MDSYRPDAASDSSGAPPDAEEQRQRRIDSLRQLASESASPMARSPADTTAPATEVMPGMSPAPPSSTPPTRRTWRLALAALIIVLALAGAGYALLPIFHPRAQGEPPIPANLTIDLSGQHIDCPSTLAWAPDGNRMAVFGSYNACDNVSSGSSGPPPFVPYLVIYDTHTGKKLKTFALADLLTAYGLNGGSVSDCAWSPDGKQLAIEVALPVQTLGGPQPLGLLLLPVDGSQPRALTGTPPAGASPNDTFQLIWNVRTGMVAGSIASRLPAALSYRWSSDGHISSDAAFPASSTDFTGRSASAADFSFWQTGQIQPIWAPYAGNLGPPAGEVFTSFQAQWSPDGQFVVFGLARTGALALRTPHDQSLCPVLGLSTHCTLATLPPADPALAAVLHAAQQPIAFTVPGQGPVANWYNASVSWRPDGQTLATILPADQFAFENESAGKRSTITFFSVKTGQPVEQQHYTCPTAALLPSFTGCSENALLWSPTGAQLALLDAGADQVTFWKM